MARENGSERPMVRIAELESIPISSKPTRRSLEEQEAPVRLETGVLMLHSVAIAEKPTHIRLFDVYATQAAYEAHLQAPHFIKYKTATENLVRSLRLIETTPILLCAKSNGQAGGPVIWM